MTPRLLMAWMALVLTLLAGCSTLVPAPDVPAPTPQAAQMAWSRVLATHVNELGEVNFEALAQDRADLDRYVRHVASLPLTSRKRSAIDTLAPVKPAC